MSDFDPIDTLSDNKEKAMEKAFRLLSVRAHSRRELGDKLKKKFKHQVVVYVISECERLGLVDDESFATLYHEELKQKGYGALRIRSNLYKKGIGSAIIDWLFDTSYCEEEELARALEVLERKKRSLLRESDHRKRRQKAYAFLLSRGFAGGIVSKLLSEVDFLSESDC